MKEFTIHLHTVHDVERFVTLVTRRNFSIEVSDGRYWVDGTSFMEIFCLNLVGPLKMRADCSEEEMELLARDVASIVGN